MASAYADAAGCCGLCAYSALEAWCILRELGPFYRSSVSGTQRNFCPQHTDPFGARCCGGPRGCCGSCCDNSFNEDDFDEHLKKVQAKNGANTEPVESQPTPSQGMSTATGDPKPTNDAEEVQ
ncbi:hypothetical protein JVT61DRAFT_8256 [Boletus reticuloceps]|uniref:Uncharacterized protein n=1 Tax=Boletus reticuloceps TaxID=495285 RepID=A0A8I2Z0N4_9AGAM|nr:hypothetical protein JVT61DRAFT_8256 [Boletus reticuloceps]